MDIAFSSRTGGENKFGRSDNETEIETRSRFGVGIHLNGFCFASILVFQPVEFCRLAAIISDRLRSVIGRWIFCARATVSCHSPPCEIAENRLFAS